MNYLILKIALEKLNKNQRGLLFVAFHFSLFTFHSNAQTLESYIQQGLQHSLALKQEDMEIQKALESINQARALFYPRLTFAPTYSLAAGGRRLNFPVGDLLNPVYSTLNQLTKSSSFPQIQNVNEQLAPNNFHDTKFTVQFAIYDPQIKYNYLIQKQLVSVQQAKRKIVENEIRYNVTSTYYQYLQTTETLKVYENTRQTLSELLRLNQKLVANQVATKDVVAAAEYEISKLNQQVAVMKKNQNLAKAYLEYLTKAPLPPEGGFKTDTQTAFDKAMSIKQIPLSGGQGGLLQLSESIKVAESAVLLQQKSAMLPSVFLGGNAGFQGFGYLFSGQEYAVVQVGLNWDLFKGYEKKSKIQIAKIQTEILKTKKLEVERQLELQIEQAYLELDAARENLTLTADAKTKAETYFKVIDSKYKNGNMLFIEWLKAQNDVTTAQLQQSLAQFDVLLKYSFLERVVNQ